MPRVYKRKTQPVDPAVLRAAVWTYRNNITTQETVAAEYNIPRSTLSYYSKPGRIVPDKIGQGRGTIFSKEEENEIEKFVVELCMRCYPLSRAAFAKFVYHMAQQTGREGRFSKNEEKKFAGRQFIHDFLRRHPRLSFRTGTCISLYRVQGFNEMAVNFFFDNLERVVQEHKFRPHQIYNVDESGFTVVAETRVKYLAEKGSKIVPVIRRCERGQLVTMVGCFSAAGIFVPPYFIFNRNLKHIERKIVEGPTGCSYATSKTGWISTEAFVLLLEFFAKHLQKDERTLLILDNHTAHLSWEGLQLCKQLGIVVLTLPPHCSHEMQPCDVGFFSPLKYRYSTSVDDWQRQNPLKFPLPEDIPGLLKVAWEKTAREEVGINAFKHTGIWDPVLDRPKREVYAQVFQDGTRSRAPIRFQVELDNGAIVDAEQAYLRQIRGEDAPIEDPQNHSEAAETGVPILISDVFDADIEMSANMDEEEFESRDDLLTFDENDIDEILGAAEEAPSTIDTTAFKELMQTYNGVPPMPEPSMSTRRKKSEVENMADLELRKNKRDQRNKRKPPNNTLASLPKKPRGRPKKVKPSEISNPTSHEELQPTTAVRKPQNTRNGSKQTTSKSNCAVEEEHEIATNANLPGPSERSVRANKLYPESPNFNSQLKKGKGAKTRNFVEQREEEEEEQVISTVTELPGPSKRSVRANKLYPESPNFNSQLKKGKGAKTRNFEEVPREEEEEEQVIFMEEDPTIVMVPAANANMQLNHRNTPLVVYDISSDEEL